MATDYTGKFEKIAAKYVMAKAAAEQAKKELDAAKAALSPAIDNHTKIRDDIYARVMKYGISPGSSIHTSKALITITGGALSVVVTNKEDVPDDYLIEVEPQVDKVGILKLWREESKRVRGTKVVTGPPVMSIRV